MKPKTIEGEVYHGVGISDHADQVLQESVHLTETGVDVEELGDTDHGGLADVRILVLETLAEWLGNVISNLVHPNAAHSTNGERPDQRVVIITVLSFFGRERLLS